MNLHQYGTYEEHKHRTAHYKHPAEFQGGKNILRTHKKLQLTE